MMLNRFIQLLWIIGIRCYRIGSERLGKEVRRLEHTQQRSIIRLYWVPVLFVVIIHIALLSGYLIYSGYEVSASVAASLGIYLILGMIMVSPVGEFILRMFCGARSIQREDWRRKAENALEAVYYAAEQKGVSLPSGIKLYYIYAPIHTSLSFGRKTICLSSALLDTNESTIKAYIAHETGHIKAYDSTLILLANTGNLPWIVLGSALRLFSRGLRYFSMFNRFRLMGFVLFLLSVALFIPRCVIWLFLTVSRLILSLGNRRKEYEADAFCVMLGFGRELRAALLSSDIDAQTNPRDLWQSLISSHPGAFDRVGRIDRVIPANYTLSPRRGLYDFLTE